LFAYHWNGTKFDVAGKALGGIFNGWAEPSRLNKITIDARGDFFLIQDNGDLRRYELNEATNTFSSQPIGTGWNVFDSITATGDGVIHARKPAGTLTRYQFEKTSDRYIHVVQDGASGWQAYTKIFSVGGDTIFGIEAGGRLAQYRYKRDPNAHWVFQNATLGTGWQVYTSVAGTSNACRLTASYVPTPPAVPTEANAPIAVIQTTGGSLEYGYTDNIGRSFWGHQLDPSDFGGLAWTPTNDNDAYTGTPGLYQASDSKVSLVLHNTNSRFAARTQTAVSAPTLGPLVDRGGVMASNGASIKDPTSNRVVTFAIDSDGKLWAKPEGTGGFQPWAQQATPATFVGTPTVSLGADDHPVVVARDTNGTFWAGTWDGFAAKGFSSLGGSGFTGQVSIVRYPGDLLRVFARDADGHIKTQKQTTAGLAFPGSWQTVGGENQTFPGSPAAILAPDTGLVEVLALGADGNNYYAQELSQGSGTWPTWDLVPGQTGTFAPTPTPFTYKIAGTPRWAFLTYTQDFQVRVVTVSTPQAAKSTKTADPAFTWKTLPAAPKK
jgi:hypothetical protein